MDLNTQKAALRKQTAEAIAALDDEARRTMDHEVVESIFELLGRYFHLGSVILAYVPMKDEVDISPVLAECLELDLCLALPRMDASGLLVLHQVRDFENDLVKSRVGVLEPRADLPLVPFPKVDLAFIPGRAFSSTGARLGRGTGHYDRSLETLAGLTVGIAYDCQVLSQVPANDKDRFVDVVLTPTQIIETHAAQGKRL